MNISFYYLFCWWSIFIISCEGRGLIIGKYHPNNVLLKHKEFIAGVPRGSWNINFRYLTPVSENPVIFVKSFDLILKIIQINKLVIKQVVVTDHFANTSMEVLPKLKKGGPEHRHVAINIKGKPKAKINFSVDVYGRVKKKN